MTVRLVPLPAAEFSDWLSRSTTEYEADLVVTGVAPEQARAQAERTMSTSFPAGKPTAMNAVFNIVDRAGTAVGYIWVGKDTSGDPTAWWVWDIAVDPAFRSQGYARSGMQLAEDYARKQGAQTLGLNVFGFNAAARGLYESLGYETTSIKMRKSLADG